MSNEQKNPSRKTRISFFVRAEDERTKDAVEIDKDKIIKLLQILDKKINKINIKEKNSTLLSNLGNMSSIMSFLKDLI